MNKCSFAIAFTYDHVGTRAEDWERFRAPQAQRDRSTTEERAVLVEPEEEES